MFYYRVTSQQAMKEFEPLRVFFHINTCGYYGLKKKAGKLVPGLFQYR